jgi:nucleotide-binding universal stress UspA family protein
MITLNKILVPVDFSDSSRKALDYGAALALKFGARLVMAHVVPSLAAFNYAFPSDTYDLEKRAYADAKERAPKLLPQEYLSILDTQTIVKSGDVRQQLLGIIEEENINMVAMGTRGRGALGHLLLGSTTESILRRVKVPILTVSHLNPEHEVHEHRIAPIRRIVYATDLSDNMRVGLRYSAQLARTFQAGLSLLNVVDNVELFHTGVPGFAAERDSALNRFRWALEEEHVSDIKTEVVVLEGEPHDTIVRFAESGSMDLIVLNLHSKTFLERAMLGSTAERVIRSAHVPVLSLPVATAGAYMTAIAATEAAS